jgi:hypothetical protein
MKKRRKISLDLGPMPTVEDLQEALRTLARRWFCRQFWWDETLGPMMWPQIGVPVAAAFLAVWGVLVVRACHGH